jgi:tetratricopeptide (TPR) repeat protein
MSEARRIGGRFMLVERVGRGAAGLVYRGVDELTGADVAVKVLTRGTDEISSEERFVREARILREVSSPYVVAYVADGRDETGELYLVVEWLRGEDLSKRMRRGPLGAEAAREVLRRAALGLGALHDKGVVHRDVKPANLVVSGEGAAIELKVIDLGVAFAHSEPSTTLHGMMVGTPHYMSPEQVLGTGAITPAADVFALGVLAFELVSGERPYRAADTFGVVARIALEPPPLLSSVIADVPPEVEAFVARAMAKSPTSRFASMAAFAEALSALPRFVVSSRDESEGEEPTRAISSLSMATSERRVVTAIFARSRDEAEAARVGARFEAVAAAHGGAAYRMLSVLHVALFGGSLSTGDEAERAARAALSLAKELPSLTLALATGRAMSDSPAQPGDVVERCAKLAQSGRREAVRVDDVTARLLGERFDVVTEGEARLLVGERPVAITARTFLGRETRCLGRDREIDALYAAYVAARDGSSARTAIVTGEAGVGKSRVRHELLRRIGETRRPPHVLFGRASVMTDTSPFGLLGAAIRGFARIALDEPTAAQRDKLGATVRSGGESSFIPLIAQIASIPLEPVVGGRDGVLETDRLKVAFETWLRELLDSRPVVVVLEDLHWGDAPSVALVESALRNLADRPLFVVAFGRPPLSSRFPRLFGALAPASVALGKLDRAAAHAIAVEALGGEVPSEVLERIVERADGNPFHLEELLRSATEDPDGAAELPDSVLAVMQSRLDRLGLEGKRILKAASVLGEALWPGAVARLLGEPIDRIEATLATLVTGEVLEARATSRFGGDRELTFRHELLRDAAYELLADADRELMHARAGEWLEERGESDSLALARHFERGRAADRARAHWERGAAQALAGSDFATAIDAAERALSAMSPGERAGRLSLLVAEAARWRGDLERALSAATQASDALARGSVGWFAAMRERIAAHGRLGHKDVIVGLAEVTLDAVADPDARSAQIAALVPGAVHVLYGGDLEGAERLAARTEALAASWGRASGASSAPTELHPLARARLHQLRAALAPARDDIETAIVENGLAVREFELAGDMRARALACSNLGYCLVSVGQYERAEEVLRAALAVATRLGLGTIIPLALQNLGVALAGAGRLDAAIDVLEQSRARFESQKDPRLEAASRLYLARCRLEHGDLDAALEEVAPVESSTFEPMKVGAHAVVAAVLRARGDAAGAASRAEAAMALLDSLGAIEDLELFTRLVYAEALADVGRLPEAMAALLFAKGRLAARVQKLRAPELRASFLERVREHARILALAGA